MDQNKKSLSTRDWIFISIIIFMIQAAVWFLSYHFGTNDSALSYISFAGTLVSIILAVLAIGYTYGESQQQKNSSLTMVNQIDGLVKIKDALKIQADALNDIQVLRADLRNYSEKVDNHLTMTNSKLNMFTDQLSSSSFQQTKQVNDVTIDINKKLIFTKLFTSGDFKLNAISLILFVLSFENKEYYGKTPVSMEYLESLEDFDIDGFDKGALYGFSFHLGLTLLRLGFANRDSNIIDDIVIDYFNQLLNEKYEALSDVFGGQGKTLLEYAKKSKFHNTK